jgi:hypothetical protein
MFLNLLGNIFASREANFVSATMCPRVGKQGNICGNIDNHKCFRNNVCLVCPGLKAWLQCLFSKFKRCIIPLLSAKM